MAMKLVKKAAPAVVDSDDNENADDFPEKSPAGADFVFADDQGNAHYKDGTVWTPADEDAEEDEDDNEEDASDGNSDEVSEDEEPDDNKVKKNAAPGASYTAKQKGKFVKAKPQMDAEDVADGGDDEATEDANGKKKMVAKSATSPEFVALDALALSAALVERVREIFTDTDVSKREEAYEDVMLNFNEVMDTAATQNWFEGSSVSKRDNTDSVNAAIEAINSTYTSVLESVGGTPVSKSDETVDIYKGLTPEAAEIVRKSAEVLEAQEAQKFESIAKSFGNVPGDKAALGAALRSLSETDPEKFEVVKQALAAADEGMADSAIFKSYGTPGIATDSLDPISKSVKEMVAKGEAKNDDEATLLLMERNPALFYKPTNA